MRQYKKVIVLGFDGLEPALVDDLLTGGQLPHFSRLQQSGSYCRLGTTLPAQTPVAWSTFATGMNPGGHGIFDFLRRDPRSYLPQIALNRIEQKNAFLPPKPVNLRDGATIWETLSHAGVPSTILRCPCSYPPRPIRGRVLSGMGVPDVRGSFGVSTFYTTDPDAAAGESESLVLLPNDPHACWSSHVLGPLDPKSRRPIELPIQLQWDEGSQQLTIRTSSRARPVTMSVGQWSDWLPVSFKVGFLQSVHGILRFYLAGAKPHLRLYASPINFDPVHPPFPISAPEEYSGQLQNQLGSYYTVGMVEDHTGLNNGRFDELAYLDQCESAWLEREAMLRLELNELQEGLLFCLFDTPDRVQHMFWRFRESDHPAHRESCPGDFSQVIPQQYVRCDRILGTVLEQLDPETLLLVLSDHGFGSFRRGVHLNTWLHEQGLLHLTDGARPGDTGVDYLRDIDWQRTKAYALGLGGIYLNQIDREASGVVSDVEAEELKRGIANQLSGLTDPSEGQVAVTSVMEREAVYTGPHQAEAPDLLVNFNRGYRASWETAVGSTPRGLFADNDRRWSGDHIFDPRLVPGVLLTNTPLANCDCDLRDMAPTVLRAFQVPPPPELEGKNLLP